MLVDRDGRPRSFIRVTLLIVLVSCGAELAATAGPKWIAAARGPRTARPAPARTDAQPDPGGIARRFGELKQASSKLSPEELSRRLAPARAPDEGPGFAPARAEYFDLVTKALALTEPERKSYGRSGLVSVERGALSMVNAYTEIYRKDLPVLVTTDSILHAMHRSFDQILVELELERMRPELRALLARVHATLKSEAAQVTGGAMHDSLADVDLYLTVARRLMDGAEEERSTATSNRDLPAAFGGNEPLVEEVLAAIAKRRLVDGFALYGGQRTVDFSQFAPRGHYTKTPQLRCYFRALMWLGRPDVGFRLARQREQRDAAILALMLKGSGELDRLAALNRTMEKLIGPGDDAGLPAMAAALTATSTTALGELGADRTLEAVLAALAQTGGGRQAIRGEVIDVPPGPGKDVPPPAVLQLFGQRFVLDSYVLSRVVFDSIKEERVMPTALDVAAALGNDEAIALLEPELNRWKYRDSLLAARDLIEEQAPEFWNANSYNLWLSALAKLDDRPAGHLPSVMQTRAWQRKQLQTQLASWAELRRDTILYVKQSYTARILCEFPTGFVEPYPELFERLAAFATQTRLWVEASGHARSGPSTAFLAQFAGIMHQLETIARKELEGRALDDAERAFIKDVISVNWRETGGGCGGPSREEVFNGWYPKLFYGVDFKKWEPTIADVHTDPNGGLNVLEVASGSANYLVVALEQAGRPVTFVGPVYSYYEFTSRERLTDEKWRTMLIEGKAPVRPAWEQPFLAAALTPQPGVVRPAPSRRQTPPPDEGDE